MDNIYIQYIFIAFLIGFAVWYLYGMIKNNFKNTTDDSCGSNCGCSPKPKKQK